MFRREVSRFSADPPKVDARVAGAAALKREKKRVKGGKISIF